MRTNTIDSGRHPSIRGLDELYDFVRGELRVRQLNGDLMPGELKVDDIVDAVVLRAYREGIERKAAEEINDRLKQLAARTIEAEVARLKSERERSVHIEEDIPETPAPEEVSTLGEEIFYFYQPDEDLKMEDILPDLAIPTPEQAVETQELARCFDAALRGLPREWRQALRLRYRDGLTGASLAKATRHSERESERMLQDATHYLRQRLAESGCEFNEADEQSVLPLDQSGAPSAVKRRTGR
jgi:RNA polymerase sigma factor (sigma-70 family)